MAARLGAARLVLNHRQQYSSTPSSWHSGNQVPTSLSPTDRLGTKSTGLQPPVDMEDGNYEQEAAAEKIRDKAMCLAELKTTVFDTYAVCAALLASFSCSTNFISEAEMFGEPDWRRLTVQLQQFLVRICIVGGIHAMLIFMFCALYAKTALAREDYGLEVYNRFSKDTGAIRQKAFWSMYYTAVLYCVQISISTYYSLSWLVSTVVSIFLLLLIARVVYDAQQIIKTAGCIFMTDEQVRVMLEDERISALPDSKRSDSTKRSVSRISQETCLSRDSQQSSLEISSREADVRSITRC